MNIFKHKAMKLQNLNKWKKKKKMNHFDETTQSIKINVINNINHN